MPVYRQLVDQVRQALQLGTLQPGDQLPTVREVVGQIAINPNTVHRAYRELEQEGLVQGRPGQGTFVQRSLVSVAPARQEELRAELGVWTRRAGEAGLDAGAMEALLRSCLEDLERGVQR
jgi:GntR family transcriptional regulator